MNKNALAPGTVLNGEHYDYCVDSVLGQGSFGITYRAHVRLRGSLGSLNSTAEVAIKEFFMRDVNGRQGTAVVDSGSDDSLFAHYRHDFRREARNLSRLHHAHIVSVLETFDQNNTSYIVMEYLPGGSLDSYILRQGRLSEREALETIIQVGEAVECMHASGMLHLDIKPMNVMRRSDGTCVLIDFGLSKRFDADGQPESSSTIGGGTMGYAPLEQAAYKKENGFMPTLDVYALGATLLKMLTGEVPPPASAVLNEGLPTGRLAAAGVGPSVITLVERAMQPIRRQRHQTVTGFLDEARRLVPGASAQAGKAVAGVAGPDAPTLPGAAIVAYDGPTIPVAVARQQGGNARQQDAKKTVTGGRSIKPSFVQDISSDTRSTVMAVLYAMKPVGSNRLGSYYDEYGEEVFKEYPVFSVSPMKFASMQKSYPSMFRRDVASALAGLMGLCRTTGLQWRLSTSDEIERWKDCYEKEYKWPKGERRTLCFSREHGLAVRVWGKNGGLRPLGQGEVLDEMAWLPAIDNDKPVCRGGGFDVPFTQPSHTSVRPVGFGYYAVEDNGVWNVVSPGEPFDYLLPQDCRFRNISTIHLVKTMGHPGPWSCHTLEKWIFGVEAVDDCGTHFFYEYVGGRFVLRLHLSPDEYAGRFFLT